MRKQFPCCDMLKRQPVCNFIATQYVVLFILTPHADAMECTYSKNYLSTQETALSIGLIGNTCISTGPLLLLSCCISTVTNTGILPRLIHSNGCNWINLSEAIPRPISNKTKTPPCIIMQGCVLDTMKNTHLTHWGRVTHICFSKLTTVGSDNDLLLAGAKPVSEPMREYS